MQTVPFEIREALGMPGASLAQACERIRTLRQTELCAQRLLDSGRLLPARAQAAAGAALPRGVKWAAAAGLAVAVVLGWAAVVDRPQGETWKSAVQSQAHPAREVERLLSAERRIWAARNN